MVNSATKSFNCKGFTLVEIMIVCICLSIIVGPIFLLLRSGSDSSMKGMARIETTLKARRVLQQVYADLKMSCYHISHDSAVYFPFEQIIKKDASRSKFEFKSFPIHEEYKEIFKEDETNEAGTKMGYRKVNKITYTLSNDKKLIRKVVGIDNKEKEKVLAENVNRFNIDENSVYINNIKQSYFFVELCMLDFVNDNKKDNSLLQGGDITPSKDVIVVDFFDVVCPDYYHSKINDIASNRNWHVLIEK
jgi:competence protein ComGC